MGPVGLSSAHPCPAATHDGPASRAPTLGRLHTRCPRPLLWVASGPMCAPLPGSWTHPAGPPARKFSEGQNLPRSTASPGSCEPSLLGAPEGEARGRGGARRPLPPAVLKFVLLQPTRRPEPHIPAPSPEPSSRRARRQDRRGPPRSFSTTVPGPAGLGGSRRRTSVFTAVSPLNRRGR